MVGLGVDQRVGFEYKWRKYDRFCGEAWLADPISLSGLLPEDAKGGALTLVMATAPRAYLAIA
eukprot:4929526-Prymnesium_polylepis.1